MMNPLKAALAEVKANHLENCLHTWDGCFCIRQKRGSPNSMSLHAWGLAIDTNQATNQMGHHGDQDPGFIECFKKHGFNWGGDWTGKKDSMHLEISLECLKKEMTKK